MKKYIYIILIIATGTFSSCKEDYLDVVPDNVATLDNAFSNRYNTQKFLYTIYSSIPNPGSVNNPALNGGDEIWYPESQNYLSGSKIAQGFQSATSPSFNLWSGSGSFYVAIRNCNIFLSRIDAVPGIQQYEKVTWKAEVNFLKAYFHFCLAKMYGPVIISDELIPVTASTKDISVKRNTIEETFTYITELMDKAIPDLPEQLQDRGTELGRITKPIAAAIKARVMITYASPLFNGNSVYSGFVNEEGVPYFPSDYSADKWTKAAEATKEAIELCHANGFGLFKKEDYINRSGNPISDVTLLKAGLRSRITEKWNKEIVWGHTATTSRMEYEAMPRLYNYLTNPVGSRHCPPLRIAEMYYSKSGVPIDEDVNYDYSNRFKLKKAIQDDKYHVEVGQQTALLNFDRETRFYADLAFDRGVWYGNGANKESDPWHIHARKGEFASVFEISAYSVTGYWPKKLVAIPSQVTQGRYLSTTRYTFPIIRLADLYLYYAEALNESKAAPDAEVYEYIDLVRNRAGLDGVVDSWANHSNNPTKPTTTEGMRSIIQQERMIEMSFEGGRFWDLRRWKLAKDYMNKPIRGWNVLKDEVEDYYTVQRIYNLSFSERDYLWPIPESEIIKSPELIQNPGW